MVPLPADRVEAFEAWLQLRWGVQSWYTRRGALACSFGMLGLRWREVSLIQLLDISRCENALFVRTAKRGQPRRIEAPPALLDCALRWRAEVAGVGDDDVLFCCRSGRPMVYNDVRRFVASSTKAVFGRRFTFHCFRHTAAIRVYRRTRDVLAVQRYLGHKSLQWTQTYLSSLEVVPTHGPVAFAGGGGPAPLRVFGGSPAEPRAVAVGHEEFSSYSGSPVQQVEEFGGLARCCVELMPVKCVVAGRHRGLCLRCGAIWEWPAFDRDQRVCVVPGRSGTSTDVVRAVASGAIEECTVRQESCTVSGEDSTLRSVDRTVDRGDVGKRRRRVRAVEPLGGSRRGPYCGEHGRVLVRQPEADGRVRCSCSACGEFYGYEP